MLGIIALLVFGSVSLFAFRTMRPRSDILRQRIHVESARNDDAETARLEGGFVERVITPGVRNIGSKLQTLLPTNWIRGVDHLLVMADQPWSLPGFLAIWLLSVTLGALIVIYLAVSSTASATQIFGMALFITFFAAFTPYARVR